MKCESASQPGSVAMCCDGSEQDSFCVGCPQASSAPDATTSRAPATTPGRRHPNSARFHELLRQAGELHDLKQSDYGAGDDPFANVRASEEWGIDGWMGAMIRLNDKVRRLQSLARNGSLKNESVYDSFIDISVYALIAYVLYEQQSSGVGESHV